MVHLARTARVHAPKIDMDAYAYKTHVKYQILELTVQNLFAMLKFKTRGPWGYIAHMRKQFK